MKDKSLAYLLWLFFGAHYAYLGRWGVQFIYWITLGGLGVWMLIDLFRIGGMVERYNIKHREYMRTIIRDNSGEPVYDQDGNYVRG